MILRKEIYATAALAGSIVFVGLSAAGMTQVVAGLAGFTLCLAVRGLALQRGWSLPAYRSRAGRSPDELGL